MSGLYHNHLMGLTGMYFARYNDNDLACQVIDEIYHTACRWLNDTDANNGWIDVNSNLPYPLDTQKQLRNQSNKHQVFYIDEYGNKSVDYAWYVLADINTQIIPVWELCSDNSVIIPMYWQPISMPNVE